MTTRFQTLPRWARRATLACATVGLVWVIAWLAMPPLLKSTLETQASSALGRQVTVGQVQFAPWSLELTLHNLRVAQAHAVAATSPPQLSISRVYLDLELQSLLNLAPVVDAIGIHHAKVSLTHLGHGRYDIDDIIARLTAAPAHSNASPPRFSLFNIAVAGAEIDFHDTPAQVTHTVRALDLTIPFLSNIGARRTIATEPRLAFKLNDQPFELKATTTPFTDDQRTSLTLNVADAKLAPYLAYWPQPAAVQLQAGRLSLAMNLTFEQKREPEVKLAGVVQLDDVSIGERTAGQDAPLLAFERFRIELADSQPLRRQLAFRSIALQKPSVSVRRNAQGVVNLANLTGPAAPASQAPAAAPWNITIDQATLDHGQALWHDHATRPAAQLALESLTVSINKLSLPLTQPAAFQGSATLAGSALTWQGQLAADAVSTQLNVQDLALSALAPYVKQTLKPDLAGTLSLTGEMTVRTPAGAPATLLAQANQITVSELTLGAPKTPQAAWAKLTLEGVSIDTRDHTAALQSLALDGPHLAVSRSEAGQWMFENWLPTAPTRTMVKSEPPSPP